MGIGTGKKESFRLQDFIVLANGGKEVPLSVELKKPIVSPKFHPGEIEGMTGNADLYILVATYTFNVDGETGKVSKFYGAGVVAESHDVTKQNSFIASRRLEIDYKRLERARIKFEKKYWD